MASRRAAYLTDVEGNLDYFHNYVAISKVLKWSDNTKSALDFQNEQDEFVFGGDSQDKGIGDVRFVRLLLDLKAKYPDRVHWIIGNRDCNKLRLAAELSDEAISDSKVQDDKEFPYWVEKDKRVTPADYLKEINETEHTKSNRLRWMLKHTMGADGAFERRKKELGLLPKGWKKIWGSSRRLSFIGSNADDDSEVVASFLKEVDPKAKDDDKFMLRYLEEGKLMHLIGNTLFVHGALNKENFGTVPGKSEACSDVKTWMKELNAWKEREVAEFKANPYEGKNSKTRAGHGLMDYGVPGGNGGKTVICSKFLEDGNAAKLQKEVVEKLAKDGIDTVVVGHIPHGECPTVIRTKLPEGAVTVVMADTSYSQMGHKSEWGVDNRGGAVSEVIIYEDATASVHGVLADGKTEIEYDVPLETNAAKTDFNVGNELRDGYWVKAKLKGSDEYLICKGKGFNLDVKRLTRATIDRILDPTFFIKPGDPFPFKWKTESGKMDWETRQDEAPRPYLRVRVGDGAEPGNPVGKETKVDPKLFRFVLEHVWGLTRPNVLLTVTGGAQDFDLDAEDKDELLEGLTDTAKSVGAWFTTGGTSAGIMKYMGLARLLYANEIPLIGIASYGIVKGKAAFEPSKDEIKEHVIAYEHACKNCKGKPSVEMDVNHSHFLFAENNHNAFGQEFHLRSQVEKAICEAEPYSAEIFDIWRSEWEEWGEWGNWKVEKPAVSSARTIPAVCICVQGGPGTIETVASSVEQGTPVLLAKGSGKAADLIADVWQVNEGKYEGDEAHGALLKGALTYLDDNKDDETVQKSSNEFDRLKEKAKTYMKEHEKEGETVFEFYGMPKKNKDKLAVVVALVKWKPKGFAVYDLEGRRGDLKGELLSCFLAWHDHQKEEECKGASGQGLDGPDLERVRNEVLLANLERVRDKILLAVKWDTPEILETELKKEKKAPWSKDAVKKYVQVAGDGLLEALCMGNDNCVEKLIDHGADITEFGVERKYLRGVEEEEDDVKKRKPKKAARTWQAVQWKILIESADASPKTQHVKQLLEEVKDHLKEKGGGETILTKTKTRKEKNRVEYADLDKYKEGCKQAGLNWKDELYKRNLDSEKCDEEKLDNLFFGAIDSFSYMDALYRSLMGDDWSYTGGCLGKTWDLFLCMVLMNRHAIAKICWRKLDLPIRSALIACQLYRAMADKPFVRAEVKLEMEQNAEEFENMAVDVQELAMKEDMDFAIESLESRVGVLGGRTTYDLAIDCNARSFVTKCCMQATDRRFFGDIDANPPKWLPAWLPIPCWVIIFCCLCTGGAAAPTFLDYRLPPEAESCRPPGQIRKIPKGYPNSPLENDVLKEKVAQENDVLKEKVTSSKGTVHQKLAEDPKVILNFSEEQKAELWLPTFTPLERYLATKKQPIDAAFDLQDESFVNVFDILCGFGGLPRWWCFLQAPVVHFQLRALIYTSVVLYFTSCITNVEHTWTEEGDRLEAQRLKDQMDWVLLYMAGSFFIELRQMWMSGLMDYIGDSWNFIDITTLASFAVARYLDDFCWVFTPMVELGRPELPEDSIFFWPKPGNTQYHTTMLDDRKKMYCVCLFFCWLRLLHLYSVNKTLGTLVRAIMTMGPDIMTFIFVWGFFLMAFAAAMFAGQKTEKVDPAEVCRATDANCQVPVSNWKIWWILRTYFLAYGGDMDLDKMTDWVTLVIFMVLLLVLQLVLNNTVFVAVLTSKFEQVLEKSETDWMFEMYDISEEFMEHPWPSPFNIPWMFWELIHFMIDEDKVKDVLDKESKACLGNGDKDSDRWWHLHIRLRHPRYWTAPMMPYEVKSELKNEEDEKEDDPKIEDDPLGTLLSSIFFRSGPNGSNSDAEEAKEFGVLGMIIIPFICLVVTMIVLVGIACIAGLLVTLVVCTLFLLFFWTCQVLPGTWNLKYLVAWFGFSLGVGYANVSASEMDSTGLWASLGDKKKECIKQMGKVMYPKYEKLVYLVVKWHKGLPFGKEKETSTEAKEKSLEYLNGDVRRRDKALLMRAKAKYLERIEKEKETSNEDVVKHVSEKIKTLEEKSKNAEENRILEKLQALEAKVDNTKNGPAASSQNTGGVKGGTEDALNRILTKIEALEANVESMKNGPAASSQNASTALLGSVAPLSLPGREALVDTEMLREALVEQERLPVDPEREDERPASGTPPNLIKQLSELGEQVLASLSPSHGTRSGTRDDTAGA